ncbi:nectin-3-like isoform X2 [Ptychodera flava]|uniref:nectin-3-like isoform X1 n=1 Tax=Ptychodera flava TaxID=63121 RepID=UPI003969EDE5
MATHRSLPRTLQLLLVLGVLNFSAVDVTSIIRSPTSQTKTFRYGSSYSSSVTLFCIVLSTDPGDSETIWTIEWDKNGVPISRNMLVLVGPLTYSDTARYTIDFGNEGGGYQETNLEIETSAANAEYDSGNYKCRVTYLTSTILESPTARLDVFVTPQSGSVLCSIGDDSQDDVFDVVSGNPITLVCRSDPTGVPQMTTDWKRVGSEGDTLEAVTSTDPINGWRILSFDWTPTKAQHHATFICTGFHPANTRNTECQLGPFNVQYEPAAAEISPLEYTVTMENQAVYFSCKADGNPPVTRIVWSNTAGDKFSNQSNNVVVIGSPGTLMSMRNFAHQDNGMYYVRCYAENDIGKSMYAEATLYVNIQSTTTASSACTDPLLSTNYLISGSNELPGEETLASEDATTVTEHSSTAPSTPTVSRQYGNTASKGQGDMTTVVSTATSTVDDIGKTSQVNTIVIIGGTIGGCVVIFTVYGVISMIRNRNAKGDSGDTKNNDRDTPLDDVSPVTDRDTEDTGQSQSES